MIIQLFLALAKLLYSRKKLPKPFFNIKNRTTGFEKEIKNNKNSQYKYLKSMNLI